MTSWTAVSSLRFETVDSKKCWRRDPRRFGTASRRTGEEDLKRRLEEGDDDNDDVLEIATPDAHLLSPEEDSVGVIELASIIYI